MPAPATDPRAAEYIRFPPGRGHILVPVGPAEASALGATLYTACRPKALAAQAAAWALLRVGGQRLLPGRRQRWEPELALATFHRLLADWSRSAGTIQAIAVYTRPQASRAGVALLVCADRRSMLVRLRISVSALSREIEVSRAAERMRPTWFRVPGVIDTGITDGWHWVAYELISSRPHRPALSASTRLTDEVSQLVEAVVPPEAAQPAHWTGSHGDLTPWNLRRAGGRRAGRLPWLIDWEDAGWAPPGLDQVYLAATAAAVTGRAVDVEALRPHAEAAGYAAAVVRGRAIDDPELTERVLATLDAIAHRGQG